MSRRLDASPGSAMSRPPRGTIIYVGAFEFPDRNTSAQRAHANALILREIGYRVVLIGVSRALPANAVIERIDHSGLPFECWEIPQPASKWMWFHRVVSINAVTSMIEAHHPDDVAAVICYDYPAVPQERLKAFFHRRGAIALAEVTEWYGVSRMRSVAGIVRNIDRPLRMRWANRRMDGIIAASGFLSDFYRKSGVPTIELPTLPPAEAEAEATVAATPDGQPKSLVFAATGFDPSVVAETRDGPKDRLDRVIAALWVASGLGADFRLDIYGVERDDYLAIAPDHVSMLADLGERVKFHGWQPRDLVRTRLTEADYSIFLRKKTIASIAGFPTKFAESVHFGTPVITNAVGSIVSYHVEGRTGHYVDYEDSDVAGRQLATILKQSAAEITAMKEYCRSSGLFHYQRYVKLLEGFMTKLEEAREIGTRPAVNPAVSAGRPPSDAEVSGSSG